MTEHSPHVLGTTRTAISLATFNVSKPDNLFRQKSEPLPALPGSRDYDNFSRADSEITRPPRQRSRTSNSESDPRKKASLGWSSFVLDKLMTAGESLSDIGRQDQNIFSQGRNFILSWRNRSDRRRTSSGISDKPERERRGSLCPVFNDPRAMEMVAKAALAKKSDTSVASKPQFGALCPVDTMEIQFTNVGNKGRKGADIAVFTSKGIINTNVTDEFNPFQIDTFRQIFDMYDKNGDNVINVEELRGILEILGYSPSPEEVKTILDRFDQDNSGTIDFDEYLVLIQHWIEQDEEQIYEAFKVFDRDGDGFVSAQELKRALTQYGEQFTEDEANEFFNMMDTDGDGVINYEEFVEYLRSMQKYSTE